VTHSSEAPSRAANPSTSPTLPLSASAALYSRAEALIPAGVSSPVRAFRKVGGTPVFFREAKGARVVDEDGNRYLDFCMAWGPLILGHAHPRVIDAVQRAVVDGLAFGTAHRGEGELAERVLAAFPYAQLVRFVVSGTEAVATAVRIARASNGRRRILKFDGCYHGHVDSLMVKAGSGVITQGLADSAGVPAQVAADTLVIPLGDVAALEQAFAEQGDQLAAAIIEPLPANNGLLLQTKEYLQKLRELTAQHGTVLIFDEVITGFRFGYHGYDKVLGIEPDLTTLGKIVGGGLPVAAVLGKRKLLEQLAPLGPVYQAGTMAGNPVCLAAGIATLSELAEGNTYRHLDALGKHVDAAYARHALARQARLPRVGPIVWPYFDVKTALPVAASDITAASVEAYHGRYASWLARGVYLPPSAYEVCFLSAAHTTADVDTLLDVLASEKQ
jgi:glutamate-1-semialdehyde 2,1-aminomutase